MSVTISSSPESSRVKSSPTIPLLPSSSLLCFNVYVRVLFLAALDSDKKTSQNLLTHPVFKDRVESLKTKSRMTLLHSLAKNSIKDLSKEELKDLILAVGVSDYVSSYKELSRVEDLYEKLFSAPHSFSQEELLNFENRAHESIRPCISFYTKK